MSTVSSLITRKPILPVVTIKKNDASIYTFNPFTSTFDFRLKRMQVKPPFGNESGSFTIEITSSDGSNSAANTLISNIDEGNEITIWIGKNNTDKIKIFTGNIESWSIQEANKNFMQLTITGPDFGSNILKNRIVQFKWSQQLDSNGNAVTTDNSTTVQQIALDLLQKTVVYPDQINLVTAENQGIIVLPSNIKGDKLQLQEFHANYEFIGDKMQELADIGGFVYWVDPDKNFHLDYPSTLSSTSSGILLTDDNNDPVALSWPATKVGIIAPETEYIRTLENHKRRVFGFGGISVAVDQSSTIDSNNSTLETYNYAMQFQPDFSTISKIKLKLSKIGTPTQDFVMELREDHQGLPTGKILRTVSKPKEFLNETGTSAVWSTFEINEEVVRGQYYWIVVRQNGTSASNTFRWHHDNIDHATSVSATSVNDVTWSLTTTPNRFYYTFEEYKGDEVYRLYNKTPISASTKWLHDDVIRKDTIKSDDVMDILLTSETNTLFKRKEIFKAQIYAPDEILTSGQKVRIRKQASGYIVDAEFTLGVIEYIFESSVDQGVGSFYFLIEAVRFVDIS